MTIAELASTLESERRTDGTLVLTRKLDAGGWAPIWDCLGNPPDLALADPSIDVQGGTLTVRGHGTVLGVPETTLSWAFEDGDDEVSVALGVTFDEALGITLPGASFGVSELGLDVFAPGHDVPVSGAIRASLTAGALAVPTLVRLPAEAGVWTIESAVSAVSLSSLEQLGALMGKLNLTAILPFDPSTVGKTLSISALQIRWDAGEQRVEQIALSIASRKSWSIVTKRLALGNPTLHLAVDDPGDKAARMVTASMEGDVVVGDVRIPVMVGRIARNEWMARLATTDLSLPTVADLLAAAGDEALAAALPAGLAELPEIVVTGLELRFDASSKRVSHASFGFDVDAPWNLLGTDGLAVHDLSVSLEVVDAPGTGTRSLSGRLSGMLLIGGSYLWAEARKEEAASPWELQCYLDENAKVSLSSIAAGLLPAGVALPAELPDLDCSDVDVTVVPETGTVRLRRRVAAGWDFPLGDGSVTISELEVSVGAAPAKRGGGRPFSIAMRGTQPSPVAAELTIDDFHLAFARGSGGAWSASGEVTATFVSSTYSLAAAYVGSKGARSLRLATKLSEPVKAVTLGRVGSLAIQELAIGVGRSASTTGGGGTSSSGDITAKGRVKVDQVFDFAGTLTVSKGARGEAGLLFEPDRGDIALSLPVPEELVAPGARAPSIELAVGRVAVEKETASATRKARWSFSADVTMTLSDIPELVRGYLPSAPTKGYLRASADTVALGFDVDIHRELAELGLTFANDKTLSLGRPTVRVNALELVAGKEPLLAATMRIGIPKRLNAIFGVDGRKRPRLDLFERSFDCRLAVGARFSLTPLTSPIKALELYTKYDKQWTDWDFGECGVLSFQVPELELRQGRWSASGGVERLTDLRIPLTPIKALLAMSGVPEAALTPIPDAVPLKGIDLRGDLYEEVRRIAGDTVLAHLDPAVDEALRALSQALSGAIERLPDRLLEDYGELPIPESGVLDISVDTLGGTSIGFRVERGQALKLLLPWLGPPVPGLVGVTLQGFSFGQRNGGATALIEFDGYIDRFDMVSLTAALTAGFGKDVSNRSILRETVAMVPTGAPVVIPLFFEELGLEHRDLLGFAMEAHWRYPQPDLGPFDYLQLLVQIFRFLTDPDVLLHRSQLPEALRLELTIGKNFIQLPKYLGGGTIGLTRALPALDVDDSIARILDALKTGRPGYAIEAIPLKLVEAGKTQWIRLGDADVSFGPLTLAASWCVTTEEEFVRRVLPEASADGTLPAVVSGGVLESLPRDEHGAVYEGGFIVLLMGAVDLGGLGFQAQFGLAVTAAGGFETGIRLSGGVASAFELSLTGRVRGDEGVEVSGRIALTSRQRTLIDASGMIAVSKTRLALEVELRLTPRFAIAGALEIGKRRIALAGEVRWPLDAGGAQFRGRGEVAFGATGIRISTEGELFGSPCTIEIAVGADPSRLFTATGRLELPALDALFEGQVRDAALEAKGRVDEAAGRVATALDELEGVDLNVNSLKAIIVTTCDRAKASASDQIGKLPTAVYRTITVNLGFRKVRRRVKVPRVNPRAEARRAAKTPLARLAALRRAAQTSDKAQLGPLVRRALQDVIASRTIKVRGRTVTILSSTQVKKLSEVRDNIESWIALLPERQGGLTIAEQHLAEVKTATTAALSAIGNAIVDGAVAKVPRVESIAFSTSLETIDRADLALDVTIRRDRQRTTHSVHLDFDHPERAGQALYQAYEGSLG